MLVAQEINASTELYGAYIVGRLWYFVVINNRDYNVLKPFDFTNIDQLKEIIGRLNWIKQYVEDKLKV